MTQKRTIYLDNSATTQICNEALEKYNEISLNCYGNPSSLHEYGFLAEKELTKARATLLSALSAKDSSVIFTASGSEANNLAIIGRAFAKERFKKGAKIITTMGEHASVNEPFDKLKQMGYEVARISTKDGKIDLEELKKELTPNVILVSMMMVNNETGALYDVASAAKMAKAISQNALVHIDATQGFCKVKFTKKQVFADMITISSHKIEGPKGVGALVVDSGVIKSGGLSPLILGGGQEMGLRSGTENVPAIAAFAVATELGMKNFDKNYEKLTELYTYLTESIKNSPELSEIKMTLPESHAPHILNITLPNIRSETMLHYLSSLGIFVSSGSACSSNSTHHSSALIAYGKSENEADSSIRISLSHRNEKADIDALIEALISGIKKLARKR